VRHLPRLRHSFRRNRQCSSGDRRFVLRQSWRCRHLQRLRLTSPVQLCAFVWSALRATSVLKEITAPLLSSATATRCERFCQVSRQFLFSGSITYDLDSRVPIGYGRHQWRPSSSLLEAPAPSPWPATALLVPTWRQREVFIVGIVSVSGASSPSGENSARRPGARPLGIHAHLATLRSYSHDALILSGAAVRHDVAYRVQVC
jgi:hypothetical protein